MSMKLKTEKKQRKIYQSKIYSQVEVSYIGISKVGRNANRANSKKETGEAYPRKG